VTQRALGLTRQQCVDALRVGDPQIEVIGGTYREVVQSSAEPLFKEATHTGEPERCFQSPQAGFPTG
jgi:hypothetical protein